MPRNQPRGAAPPEASFPGSPSPIFKYLSATYACTELRSLRGSWVVVDEPVMSYLRWGSIFVGALSLFSLLERLINFGTRPARRRDPELLPGRTVPSRGQAYRLFANATCRLPYKCTGTALDAVILYTLFSLAIARFTYNKQDSLKKAGWKYTKCYHSLALGIHLAADRDRQHPGALRVTQAGRFQYPVWLGCRGRQGHRDLYRPIWRQRLPIGLNGLHGRGG